MRTPSLSSFVLLLALLLAACQGSGLREILSASPSPRAGYPAPLSNVETSSPQAYPPAETQPALATPVSDSPAAGVCDLAQGELVTFEIYPDIPAPRCSKATPEQRLKVINRTESDLQVSIAGFQASLAPGEEAVIGPPLGTYLLPGVHVVMTSAYGGGGGPELWLLEAAPEETAYPEP